tara:strand:- start:1596 stop:2462 length:867 start_codon:yes stop_codon:yes gene_type:complete
MSEVIFQSSSGMQMKEFLEKYKDKIKNKDILYVVQTNLAEDNAKTTIQTRQRISGVNIKIGKSESNAYSRLLSYTHMGSNFTPKYKQSGIRVLYIRSYQKRTSMESGKKMIQKVELSLKRFLRSNGNKVTSRGSEVFRINPEELFEIIENLEIEDVHEPLRVGERLGKRLVWMTKDTITGKLKLHYDPEYKKIMKDFLDDPDHEISNQPSITGGANLNRPAQTQSVSNTQQINNITTPPPGMNTPPSPQQSVNNLNSQAQPFNPQITPSTPYSFLNALFSPRSLFLSP